MGVEIGRSDELRHSVWNTQHGIRHLGSNEQMVIFIKKNFGLFWPWQPIHFLLTPPIPRLSVSAEYSSNCITSHCFGACVSSWCEILAGRNHVLVLDLWPAVQHLKSVISHELCGLGQVSLPLSVSDVFNVEENKTCQIRLSRISNEIVNMNVLCMVLSELLLWLCHAGWKGAVIQAWHLTASDLWPSTTFSSLSQGILMWPSFFKHSWLIYT